MRRSLRDLAGPALFEAAFVVLGVILAYAVNEWREGRVHRQEAAAATRAIAAELDANRGAVRQSLAYHQGLLDTLRALRGGEGAGIALFSRGFVSPAQVSTTAWDVASETGVLTHVPYADVLRLSRAYAQQRRYDEQARTVGQLIYGELYRAGPMAIVANRGNLASLISSFAYRERQLVALYDTTLAATRDSTRATERAAQPATASRGTP